MTARTSTSGYRYYALGAMTLVVTFNYTDRGLITLLLQPIKIDLNLSDTQLGFLTGIAFGIFYATLGLPIARLADRGNRVTIASLALGLWGLTVMGCVFVTNFIQLLAARVGAAIGEAGCMPPTYSLVGDYFPGSAERTRAMTIYMLAGAFATLISFVVGGWVEERYGWRTAFFVMGCPALLVALVIRLTVTEPERNVHTGNLARPSLRNVVRTIWQRRSVRHITLGIIIFWTMGLGMLPWYSAFLMRSHGMQVAEVGLSMGLICAVSGLVGIAAGGYSVARWLARHEKAQLRLIAVMVACIVPCFVLFLLLPSKLFALIALVPLIMLYNAYLGPTFALIQRLTGDEMRATVLAVIMLLANLIGMGTGPQIVGMLSDWLAPWYGQDSLRYAMLLLAIVAWWAAYHFWQASKTVVDDLACGADSREWKTKARARESAIRGAAH